MDLRSLSLNDRALVEALAEIGRTECAGHSWAEVEPMLAICWNQIHRRESALEWHEIAPLIRAACERAH